MTLLAVVLAGALIGIRPNAKSAPTITLNPSKDNTLYEYVDVDLSNGAGNHFFAGRTGQGYIRRGVLAFDIAGNIPPGSAITGVSLSMRLSRGGGNGTPMIELHKLIADWGEGTSIASGQEGQGALATTNDATWRHRFYDTTLWLAQGGDFAATVSASQSVGALGTYTWSSAQMVADVQSWLNDPPNNFGWLVRGEESTSGTAKRFDTRESTSPPVLTIEYTASNPTPTATASPTPTSTATATATATPTATATSTVTPSATPTATPTPTATTTPTPSPFSHPLLFPPVTTNPNVSVSIDEGCVQILDGPCTYMWTYGGTYPGLLIRRPTGQTTHVTFTNNLDPVAGPLTVHHHGNHSASADDGYVTGANFLIGIGESRTYTYEGIENGHNERGRMQFYHDHRLDETGMNVWMGLTGLYIIDDPADPATLPSGVYDLPLVLADRQFDDQNQIQYYYDRLGVFGDKMLINGVYQPYLDVADRKYRLRILNGSNARVYILTLSTGDAFTQVGTESGLLPAPVARTAMQFGPAERLDVVVDFAGKLGQDLYLVDAYTMTALLKFRVTQHVTDTSIVPATLRPLPDIGDPTVTRNFSFDQTAGHWTINGLQFDPNRIDARPVLGTTERWIFTNPTERTHMVHIHDVDQQCLSRDGGECYPYETMKETWALGPGETIELKMKFTDHLGKYMFHCHILEHEDDGMMSQFEVVPPRATPVPRPRPTPAPRP